MAPSLARMILASVQPFGCVLVARGETDNSLAARCEECLALVEFSPLSPVDIKTRELRSFTREHSKCAAKPVDEPPLIRSVT